MEQIDHPDYKSDPEYFAFCTEVEGFGRRAKMFYTTALAQHSVDTVRITAHDGSALVDLKTYRPWVSSAEPLSGGKSARERTEQEDLPQVVAEHRLGQQIPAATGSTISQFDGIGRLSELDRGQPAGTSLTAVPATVSRLSRH